MTPESQQALHSVQQAVRALDYLSVLYGRDIVDGALEQANVYTQKNPGNYLLIIDGATLGLISANSSDRSLASAVFSVDLIEQSGVEEYA